VPGAMSAAGTRRTDAQSSATCRCRPTASSVAAAASDVAAGGVEEDEEPLLEQAAAVRIATMAPAVARPLAG